MRTDRFAGLPLIASGVSLVIAAGPVPEPGRLGCPAPMLMSAWPPCSLGPTFHE